jgi:hypothetical protein
LILAVAAYVKNRNSPLPQDLRIALHCQTWNTLPEWPPNLYAQPAGLLRRMSTALSVYRAMSSFYKSNNWAKFSKRHPDLWRIVQSVIKLDRSNDD